MHEIDDADHRKQRVDQRRDIRPQHIEIAEEKVGRGQEYADGHRPHQGRPEGNSQTAQIGGFFNRRIAQIEMPQQPLAADEKHQGGYRGKEGGGQQGLPFEGDDEAPPGRNELVHRAHFPAIGVDDFAAEGIVDVDALRQRIGKKLAPGIADRIDHLVDFEQLVFGFAENRVDLRLFRRQAGAFIRDDLRFGRLPLGWRCAQLFQAGIDLGDARPERNADIQQFLGARFQIEAQIGKRRVGIGLLLEFLFIGRDLLLQRIDGRALFGDDVRFDGRRWRWRHGRRLRCSGRRLRCRGWCGRCGGRFWRRGLRQSQLHRGRQKQNGGNRQKNLPKER